MTRVRIYGASDDLVEIDGNHPIAEEYGPGDRGLFRAVLSDTVSADTALLYVEYVDPGVWMVGLAPHDDGFPIPAAWSPTIGHDSALCDYSAVLVLDLPATVTLEVLDGTDPRKEQQ